MNDLRKKIFDSMGDAGFGSRLIKYLRMQLLKPEQIVGYLPHEGVVYDMGCGFGLCSVAAAYQEKVRVTGYDIDEVRIRNNQEMFAAVKNLQFQVVDIFDFQPHESADGIMIIDSLHYFSPEDQRTILTSLWELLNPEGKLIIRDVVRDASFSFLWNRLHEKTLVEITKWTKTNSAKTWFLDESQWQTIFSSLNGSFLLERIECHKYLPYNDHIFVLAKKA